MHKTIGNNQPTPKKKMNIHIIGGGNLGVSVAIGIAKFHNHKVTNPQEY
jgi:NADH dehydrogenase FAD-containing subunit